MTIRKQFVIATVAVAMFGSAVAVRAQKKSDRPSSQSYTTADGQSYSAIAIRGQDAPAKATDVLVLFDTSASQAGEHRQAGFDALRALLSTLGDKDRVKLMATDIKTVALTDAFVGPDSEAITGAVEKLDRIVPLGSGDLGSALSSAGDSFAEGENRRAVVYIGDGMSKAKLIGEQAFDDLIASYSEKKISVTSYAVGPETGEELLATVANYTGGQLVVDDPDLKAAKIGKFLANSARAAVTWPTEIQLPDGLTAAQSLVPLRPDRDSIYFVKGKLDNPAALKISGQLDGAAAELEVIVPASAADDANSHLASLYQAAEQGVKLPTLGSKGLEMARKHLAGGVSQLNRLGKNALAAGNADAAERLANQALKVDPANADAAAVAGAARRGLVEDAAGGGGALDADDEDLLGQVIAEEGGRGIDAVEERNRILEQIWKNDVATALEKARTTMDSDPSTAEANLKLLLQSLGDAPDLRADVQAQLAQKLKSTIISASLRKVELDEDRRTREEALAQRLARQRVIEDLDRDQQKVEQLMERFNSLMKEGRYIEAEDQVAVEALRIEPDSPTLHAASMHASFKGAYDDFVAIVEQRNRAASRTLLEVEKTGIPFPGDPPIVYPSAEVWEELSMRRKKYASVDLQKRGGQEEKILAQLDEPTRMDFEEMPLDEVVDYLKEYHGIEMQLDTKALDEVGIGSDTPVTSRVRGISLRSGLRLMLKAVDPTLTYAIENEVLMLTTREAAEENLVTKVYPVADLVLPTQLSGFAGSGGFSQGGAQAGFGGGGFGGGGRGGQGFGGVGHAGHAAVEKLAAELLHQRRQHQRQHEAG